MKGYLICFTWTDGVKDSFNVENDKERDINIKGMLDTNEFIQISYRRIYDNGKYGNIIDVL